MQDDPNKAQHPLADAAPAIAADDGPSAGLVSLDPLRLVDAAVLLICLAYVLAALVGLPFFGDGAHYLFRLRMDTVPYLPDLRFAAVPMQLPAYLASQLGADVLTTRHLFAFGQVLLPVASVIACWLIVRRRAPRLMLFPALALLLSQINFSSVSELLAMQYVAWPLVLAMGLSAERRWVRRYAAIAGPVLLFQHPLAFAALFGLAAFALIIAWSHAELRRRWLRIALWLAVCGVARVLWSSIGLSEHYEQRMVSADGAAFYVLTVTWGQHLLLGAVTVLGLGWAGWLLHQGRGRRAMDVAAGPRLLIWLTVLAVPPLVLMVSYEICWGQGVRLKSASTIGVSFLLMAAAGLLGLFGLPRRTTAPRHPHRAPVSGLSREEAADLSSRPRASPLETRSCPPYRAALRGTLPATMVALLGIAALLLVKSAAWWTGTRGLQNIVADTPGACVPLSRHTPYALQWPWMVIVDDWNAPMNALIFRPQLRDPDTGALVPVALLLPDNGCDWLELQPEVYPTPWLSVSWERLDAKFGPLRRPKSLGGTAQ
jgi:hypothetical protein